MTNFAGCWEKFRRAEQHLDEVETMVDAFQASNPYPVVKDYDPQRKRNVFRASNPPPIPTDFALILGDAVHNARSAFDHFAYQAIPAPNDRTGFPVIRKGFPRRGQLRSLLINKMPGASPDLCKAILACEPYEGGKGHYLWVLDHLDIMDKHILLVPVVTAYRAVFIDMWAGLRGMPGIGELPRAVIGLKPADRLPVEDGTELFSAPADSDPDPQFAFEIALAKPQVLSREPIVPAVRGLFDEAKGLLQRLIPLA